MSQVVHVNDDNFQTEVLDSSSPVLVDFSAAWCGPCKQLAPIVEDLAKEYDGRLKVAKIDVEESQQTAMKYGIMSVPTLLFLVDGKVTDQLVGSVPRQTLEERISKVL
jgi:thioredoxin